MTEYVDIKEIKVDERIRKYFDEGKILDLSDDIEANGLLHAPVLQESGATLVAGERRYRAIQILHNAGRSFEYNGAVVPKGSLPVTRISQRSEADLIEAELSENAAREDLSWQENSAALARLHALRETQNPNQTLTDTASELKGSKATGSEVMEVSEAVTLANHLDDQDVAKAKSKKEALKIIQSKANKAHHERLAAEFDFKTARKVPHEIQVGDASVWLKNAADNTYDVLITDPPYGVGANKFGDQQFLDHEYDDSLGTWEVLMHTLAKEGYRICKPEAHAYVFCDIRHWERLAGFFKSAGWDVWATPLIWDKGNMGLLPRPEHGPRRSYEAILYAIKGNKKVNAVYHDVIRVSTTTGKERHAAEKPVDLYEDLLKRSVKPGDLILDTFAGSGPVFPAANRLSCIAHGVEKETANVGICLSRLEEK